jgi:hypothetical protein
MFTVAACLALATYLTLLALVYKVLTPQDELKYLEPQERQAASVAALVLVVAFLLVNSRFVFFAGRRSQPWRRRMGGDRPRRPGNSVVRHRDQRAAGEHAERRHGRPRHEEPRLLAALVRVDPPQVRARAFVSVIA